jgi:hypothetical protein
MGVLRRVLDEPVQKRRQFVYVTGEEAASAPTRPTPTT